MGPELVAAAVAAHAERCRGSWGQSRPCGFEGNPAALNGVLARMIGSADQLCSERALPSSGCNQALESSHGRVHANLDGKQRRFQPLASARRRRQDMELSSFP